VITGFTELGEGRLEAVYVAERRGSELMPAGLVRFGFTGKDLWHALDALRAGPPRHGIVPVQPRLQALIKYFGRYKCGWIRDGVSCSCGHIDRRRCCETRRCARATECHQAI